jgi:hypothetical protein
MLLVLELGLEPAQLDAAALNALDLTAFAAAV